MTFSPLPSIRIDAFAQGYIDCALWCGLPDENDQPLERIYDQSDIAPNAIAKMLADCVAFATTNSDLIDALNNLGHRDDYLGHDFWLTRNGHGAGYWDGDIEEPMAGLLTESCKSFGESDLYIGDDGLIYVSPA